VLNRGIGTVLLGHLVRDVLARGRRPVARFVPTAANRIMLVTLRFAGFEPAGPDVLAFDPRRPPPPRPGHVRILDGRDR
jgi:hypothetical protein